MRSYFQCIPFSLYVPWEGGDRSLPSPPVCQFFLVMLVLALWMSSSTMLGDGTLDHRIWPVLQQCRVVQLGEQELVLFVHCRGVAVFTSRGTDADTRQPRKCGCDQLLAGMIRVPVECLNCAEQEQQEYVAWGTAPGG